MTDEYTENSYSEPNSLIIMDEADLKLNRAVTFEWLYTNGLGGYASSTIVGLNTRGYHGLLISSMNPPVDRWLTLCRLDEVIATSAGEFNLSTEQTVDGVVNRGYRMLTRFELNPLPQMTYEAENVRVDKTVFMAYGRNLSVVNYEVKNTEEAVLTVTPVQTCRDYHSRYEKLAFTPGAETVNAHSYLTFDDRATSPWMYSYTPDAEFAQSEIRVSATQVYRKEKANGLAHLEQLFIPGVFHTVLDPGEHFLSFLFAVGPTQKELMSSLGSLTKAESKDFAKLRFEELRRRKMLFDRAFSMSTKERDEEIEWLILNADSFIVDRASTNMKSVIAGYHELADIGLDALIALSGITMSIGRFQDARAILTTYARHSRYGLVANDFPDKGIQPEYDSVDASLWYIMGVWKYIQATNDTEFLRGIIWDTMESVIAAYRIGTKYGIHEDHDGLICAGIEGVELTWMNEKIGNWVATPRIGKCVETNALWYNVLMAMADMSELMGRDPYEFKAVASWIKEAFVQTFWNEELQCLYDVVSDAGVDVSIRPNQIFAISLPYPLLEGRMAHAVLKTVTKELLTPYGLRTLSTQDPRYSRACTGGPRSRADATHQGTVHPWLIGPYISAFLSITGRTPDNMTHAEQEFFRPVLSTVRKGCLGTVSDMYDGSKPHRDRGVVSRARNVAELLRVYFEEL
ncbi:MAG: glycogen debranching protein [Candidatus Thorarchaeota archaeon]|nr:glycogen debranching protein [Candidatus Thorarchaeota archaeon]